MGRKFLTQGIKEENVKSSKMDEVDTEAHISYLLDNSTQYWYHLSLRNENFLNIGLIVIYFPS